MIGGSKACFTKKYQQQSPCSFAYKDQCIDDRLFLYRRKNAVNRFIKAILKEYRYCRKVMKKNLKKMKKKNANKKKN